MDDTTTPAEAGSATGASIGGIPVTADGVAIPDTALPESPAETAEVAPDETSTESVSTASVESNSATSDADDDLIEWAKKKGLDPTDPIKALKVARDNERSFHATRSKQSELQKLVNTTSNDNDVYIPQGVDPKVALLELRVNHPDVTPGSDLDTEMTAIVGDDPGFWVNNLENAYKIARANLSERTTNEAVEQARKQERETLSKTSRLAQPTSQPTTSGDPTGLTWAKIDAMPIAEYAKRREEINTWMNRQGK